jgi:spermidine synthase
MATVGFYSAVGQVLLVREFLVTFFGNELCLGVLFGNWLLGIFLGAALGSRVADRLRDAKRTFGALLLFLSPLLPLQIYSIRTIRHALEIPPGQYISFAQLLLSSPLLIAPFCFFVGLTFPIACRCFASSGGKADFQIGWVYVLETLGHIAGGLIATFVLIIYFNPFQIMAILNMAAAAAAFSLFMGHDRLHTRAIGSAAALFLGCSMLVSLGTGFARRLDGRTIEARWKSISPRTDLVVSVDSKYQNIAVGKLGEQYNVFGNGQYQTSFPDPYSSAATAHFVLAQHPAPRRVLLIGGGVEGLIGEMLKHPLERLDYVELDPLMISTIMAYLDGKSLRALDDPRLRVHHVDGRYYVKKTAERYDLVLLDLPDPSTAMLNRFYTVDFFSEVKNTLRPGGVLALGSSSAEDYLGEEIGNYAGSIYQSLKQAFPIVLVTPGTHSYYFATLQSGVVSADPEVLGDRFAKRKIDTRYFTRYNYHLFLPDEKTRFINRALEERREVPLNTDLRPITYYFNLVLWDRFSGRRQESFFRALAHLRLNHVLAAVGALLLLRIAYILIRKPRRESELRFSLLYAIATTGIAAMAIEIILIFGFQNLFGYVYQKIGAIVALFMIGLALGSAGMNWFAVRRERGGLGCLALLEGLVALFAVGIPVMIRFLAPEMGPLLMEPFFYSLVMVGGLLTGAEFPLGVRLYFTTGAGEGRTGGIVDALDHMGATVGSLLTGVFLVPLLGIVQSCAVLFSLKAVSLVLIGFYALRRRST